MASDMESLSVKHRWHNTTVRATCANYHLDTQFKPSNNDAENLLKIDVASIKKNVDYILSVLKCNDTLCVSRALKKCSWLFVDQQYAHVMNPEYLHEHLFPFMTTKCYIKLIKHIRNTLKDESQAEKFYLNQNDKDEALKWLPLCSVPFIEEKIGRHLKNHMKVRTFKRLCEKSATIFSIIMTKSSLAPRDRHYLEAVTFLLNTNMELYMDIMENVACDKPKLNDKQTHLLMKRSMRRVLSKFAIYDGSLDIPTFLKYLTSQESKIFLIRLAKSSVPNIDRYFKHCIQKLSNDEQFEFIKKVFIDSAHRGFGQHELHPESEAYGMMKLAEKIRCNDYFDWYEYAPFDTAYAKFMEEIAGGTKINEKFYMTKVLMNCARNNMKHIRTLLRFVIENSKKFHSTEFIPDFVDKLLTLTNIVEYDTATWNMLNTIFNEYKTICIEEQDCKQCVIVYCTLHDLTIPETVFINYRFNTMKTYKHKMNQHQREKMFSYLYMDLVSKLGKPVVDKEQFENHIYYLSNALQLLTDWDKELLDYPLIFDKIIETPKIKRDNDWNIDLSMLYNLNKKWRRLMFEASVELNPCEATYLNSLKHEPRLLVKYGREIHAQRSADTSPYQSKVDDTVDTSPRVVAKLRSYWPYSIAKEWSDEYAKSIKKQTQTQKGLVRSLCAILPSQQLMDTITKNAPSEARIDWSKADDRVIALQRFIASNMHVARPQPPPEAVLMYAKGDYLKFALPSLLAIFYNIPPSMLQINIGWRILNAPVSVQKHGLRIVYQRGKYAEIQKIFINFWNSCNNTSIRAIIFAFTHAILIKQKDKKKIRETWQLLASFIDSLCIEEDKKIYELLLNPDPVPFIIRGQFLMKSHHYMRKSFPNDKSIYEERIRNLEYYSRKIMQQLSTDFVEGIIKAFIDKEYFNCDLRSSPHEMLQVLTAYLMCTHNEMIQMQRYNIILVPIIERSLRQWSENPLGNNFIRTNFHGLTDSLIHDLKHYVVDYNLLIPTNMFVKIQGELKSLPIQQNYMLLTKWKLLVELTTLVEIHYYNSNMTWPDVSLKLAPKFGQNCLEYLKEDIATHFNCIYLLFAKVFDNILSLFSSDAQILIYEQFLSDRNCIPAYLITIQLCKYNMKMDPEYNKIKRIISSNNSLEVIFHFGNRV